MHKIQATNRDTNPEEITAYLDDIANRANFDEESSATSKQLMIWNP